MKKDITTKIVINSPAKTIWETLVNFHNYPKWNPFIKEIYGNLNINSRLKVTIKPENSSEMIFNPIITKVEKNKIFEWKGKLFIKGLFDGIHRFEIQENHDGTSTFIHSESFKGILVGILNIENTKTGFDKMNIALKRVCEG